MFVRLCLAITALFVSVSTAVQPQAPWPGFRGPAMNGLAPDAILPTEWSATKHVAWMAEVPGQGWSSPIVVGNTVIVTSAVSGRPFKKPAPGIYGNDYIAELRAQGLSTTEINARVRARRPDEVDGMPHDRRDRARDDLLDRRNPLARGRGLALERLQRRLSLPAVVARAAVRDRELVALRGHAWTSAVRLGVSH